MYFKSHLPNASITCPVQLPDGDNAGFRGLLYTLAKLMEEYNAVKKSKVGKRVDQRVAGKATGKAMGKLFK